VAKAVRTGEEDYCSIDYMYDMRVAGLFWVTAEGFISKTGDTLCSRYLFGTSVTNLVFGHTYVLYE
jgi:hypothetical protein